MAIVTVCDGQRVMCRGRVFGPGDQFDAGDLAWSLVERGLVVLAGVVDVEATPAPPDTIAAEPEPAQEPEVIKVPIGPKPRGRKHDRTEEGD